jgi:hypothetical protein
MIRLSGSVCIDAPADVVWARLATLEDIQLWSESVLHARCEGQRSRGAGAERTCDLVGNVTITERWIRWDEGRSFTHEGFGIPLVKRARNVWSVQPEGARQSRLTSAAEVELKGGVVGRLLEPIMVALSRRMASHALAAFKYLVEHGRPYGGRHSELPRAPATC